METGPSCPSLARGQGTRLGVFSGLCLAVSCGPTPIFCVDMLRGDTPITVLPGHWLVCTPQTCNQVHSDVHWCWTVLVRLMFGSRSKGCPFASCRPASTRRTSYLLKAKKCKKAESDLRPQLPNPSRTTSARIALLYPIRSRRRHHALVCLLFSVSHVSPLPYQDFPAVCQAYLKRFLTSCLLYDPFKSLPILPCARLCVFNDALEKPQSFTSNC